MDKTVDGLIYFNFISTIGIGFKTQNPSGFSVRTFTLYHATRLYCLFRNTMNLFENKVVNKFFITSNSGVKYVDLLIFLQKVNGQISYQFSNVFLKRLILRDQRLCRTPVLEPGGHFLGLLCQHIETLPRGLRV